jgi:hypothetical protein
VPSIWGGWLLYVLGWAQDERPADLHMAQPNVPVSKTGQFPPARLVDGCCSHGRSLESSAQQKINYRAGTLLLSRRLPIL